MRDFFALYATSITVRMCTTFILGFLSAVLAGVLAVAIVVAIVNLVPA